jgi:hypothetical protein
MVCHLKSSYSSALCGTHSTVEKDTFETLEDGCVEKHTAILKMTLPSGLQLPVFS